MTIFGIFLALCGVFLVLWSIFYSSRKISFLFRFLVLFSGLSLILFTIFPSILSYLGQIFGLERGADLLVYASVAVLLYASLFLYKKISFLEEKTTLLSRNLTLMQAENSEKIEAETTLVMACYNEEKIIEKTIENIFDFDENLAIIAINDGSSDATLEILKKISWKYGRLIVLNHIQNLGQWAALETGFEYIRREKIITKFVATFDSDGQMQIADLPKMINFLKKNPKTEIILGSRFLKKKSQNMPLMRKIILKIGIIFTKIFSWISLTDTHNGYRVMRVETIEKIKISLDRMGHASEILDIIARKKIIFHEMPVTIQYTDYSLKKGQKSSNSIKIAMRMIFKNFF